MGPCQSTEQDRSSRHAHPRERAGTKSVTHYCYDDRKHAYSFPFIAMEVIRNNMAARTTDLRLYLDVVQDPGKVCTRWMVALPLFS